MKSHPASIKTTDNRKRLEIQNGLDVRITFTDFPDVSILYAHDMQTGSSVALELTPAMMAAVAALKVA